tara:strand:- start:1687 stop:2151 length:465 start_codon:yes stop_codon:yes gene_type:complete
VAKKSKRHNKSHRTKKASRQSSSHSRSKKSNKFARRLPRKEEEEDKRERVLSLYRAVLRAKEIERCDFWFLPFVCARLCVVSGKRERERESRGDDVVSVVCGRLSLFPFLWFRAKEGKSNTKTNNHCFLVRACLLTARMFFISHQNTGSRHGPS